MPSSAEGPTLHAKPLNCAYLSRVLGVDLHAPTARVPVKNLADANFRASRLPDREEPRQQSLAFCVRKRAPASEFARLPDRPTDWPVGQVLTRLQSLQHRRLARQCVSPHHAVFPWF